MTKVRVGEFLAWPGTMDNTNGVGWIIILEREKVR